MLRWPVGSNAWKNAIAGFLAGYSAVAAALFFYLQESWAHSAPTHPDPVHGQVFRHNEHGWITFFTAFQVTSGGMLMVTALLAFAAGFNIAPRRNVRYFRGRFSFAMRADPDDPGGWMKVGMICGAICALPIIFGLGPYVIAGLNRIGIAFGF